MDDFDFWLDPDGVDSEAAALDTWSDGLAEIASGLVPIVISGDPGATVYSGAAGVCSQVHTGLLQWTAHMQNVFSSISTELRSVASEGRETDLSTAARLDLYDPTEYNDHDPTPGNWTNKSARPEITPEYDRPPDSDFMPAPKWNAANGSSFYLDPGPGAFSAAGEFAEPLFSNFMVDPVGDVKEALGAMGVSRMRDWLFQGFGGGWFQLREYAYILEKMSVFLSDMRGALGQIFGGVSLYWQGYSANSAGEYFDEVLAVIDAAKDGCAKASEDITTFCDAVKNSADLIGGLLEDLAIDVYIAALAIAAGKKLSFASVFGVGAIASGAAKWLDITGKIGDMQTLVDAMTTAKDLGTQLSDFTSSLRIPQMAETS